MDLGSAQTRWVHTATMTAESSSPGHAREFVRRHLVEHQMWHLVEDVQLVVSELATNAVVHAQSSFTVTLRALRRSVLLTVEDEAASVPSLGATKVMATSGRGLVIIDVLSREWGVDTSTDGGKTVWALFDV